MLTIFVLGSNSFAGSCFVNAALTAGHKVIGINRSPEGPHFFLRYRHNSRRANYQFHQLDLNRDLAGIKELVISATPDYVVDFAGQGMVAESWLHPEQWYQTNIISKVRLHDFLRSQDWLKKYIRVSTPEVYGSTQQLIQEDHSYNPSTPYAVSHAAIDMSLTAFYKQYGFPVVLTRFANFFGPGQQLYRIVPRTILFILDGRKLQLHGGGTSVRAFIYGDDVADGLLRVIDRGRIGDAYHFSPDKFFTIRQIVERICEKMGANFSKTIEVSADRQGKDQAYLMDASKAVKELGWKAAIDLDAGIDATISWVRTNFNDLKTLSWNYEHKQ